MSSHGQKDENGIKIAVKLDNKQPFLGVYNPQEPLIIFIDKLLKHWDLDGAENFAMRFTDELKYYVTEKNRGLIKPGTVLELLPSASRQTKRIIDCLMKSSDASERFNASAKLHEMSSDVTFAEEFINRDGLVMLIDQIERRNFDQSVLPNILQSFQDLMDHGIVPWDTLKPLFIQSIASYVNKPSDSQVLKMSLSILEKIILNSQSHYQLVEKEVTLSNLLMRISNSSSSRSSNANRPVDDDRLGIQKAVLALINAQFRKADPSKKKYFVSTISSKQFRYIINHSILSQNQDYEGNVSIDKEMSHQLYVLQQLLLNQYEERMRTSLDPQDTDATEKIKELRKIAFEMDGDVQSKDVTTRRMEIKKEFKKLGFKDDVNPAQDFNEVPPGMLALDNMSFFANQHSDKYYKLVLENCCHSDSHECPFGRASIELTKLLCEILRIGEPPDNSGCTFYPMLFTHDHPFEELFCICIVLLNKTWKDMKATTEDFSKVLNVVKEQIIRTMVLATTTFDKFNEELNKLPYARIAEIWLSDRLNQEQEEMQAQPIKELRAQIEPDILELIQQHRLNFLVEGSVFKHKSTRREKHWFCRLSPNHKFFHYGECEEKSNPSIEELKEKIGVVEIKGLVTGKDCQFFKDKWRKNVQIFAFSLLLESNNVNDNKTLDFLTQDEIVYNYWTDGINALLRQRMISTTADDDLNTLLDMEISLRLLDAEGVAIPHQPPPIPSPPPNYNFCYQQG